MRESETLNLPDGRALSFAIYGSPAPQTTVFYFHGYPSSRLEGKLWHTAASDLSVRLVVPDRPGMGNSSPQPGRTLLDWPHDVAALADHLKVERFYVMGWSGGGPYTLACVKGIPRERLAGAAVVSGLYPAAFGTAGMLMTVRLMLWVGPWFPSLVGTVLDMAIGKAARNEDRKVLEELHIKDIKNRPAVDRAALRDEKNIAGFVEGTREALTQGGAGAGCESRIYGSLWGFELEELNVGEGGVPVTLWHGADDLNCPVSMARRAKERMPGVRLNVMDGEGHVSYAFREQKTILQDLVGGLDE